MATKTFELDVAAKGRLDSLAEQRGCSADGLIREAIDKYLDWQNRWARVLAEADAAYEHNLTAGLHVKGEEADAWLQRLANGEDCDPRECYT